MYYRAVFIPDWLSSADVLEWHQIPVFRGLKALPRRARRGLLGHHVGRAGDVPRGEHRCRRGSLGWLLARRTAARVDVLAENDASPTMAHRQGATGPTRARAVRGVGVEPHVEAR